MKWLSNFRENMQLRKERNTFENKYYTTQEKYVALLESKVDQTAELEKYKDLCIEQKKQIREQKSTIADLELKIEKLESKGGKNNGKTKENI